MAIPGEGGWERDPTGDGPFASPERQPSLDELDRNDPHGHFGRPRHHRHHQDRERDRGRERGEGPERNDDEGVGEDPDRDRRDPGEDLGAVPEDAREPSLSPREVEPDQDPERDPDHPGEAVDDERADDRVGDASSGDARRRGEVREEANRPRCDPSFGRIGDDDDQGHYRDDERHPACRATSARELPRRHEDPWKPGGSAPYAPPAGRPRGCSCHTDVQRVPGDRANQEACDRVQDQGVDHEEEHDGDQGLEVEGGAGLPELISDDR